MSDNRTSIAVTTSVQAKLDKVGEFKDSYNSIIDRLVDFYLANTGTKNVVSKEKEQSASNTRSKTNPIGETGDAN